MDENLKKLAGGLTGVVVSATGMSLTDANALVGLICSIMGVVISILSCVVIPLIRWYKKSKVDGKITAEEKDELIDTLQKGSTEVLERIDEIKGDKKDA